MIFSSISSESSSLLSILQGPETILGLIDVKCPYKLITTLHINANPFQDIQVSRSQPTVSLESVGVKRFRKKTFTEEKANLEMGKRAAVAKPCLCLCRRLPQILPESIRQIIRLLTQRKNYFASSGQVGTVCVIPWGTLL